MTKRTMGVSCFEIFVEYPFTVDYPKEDQAKIDKIIDKISAAFDAVYQGGSFKVTVDSVVGMSDIQDEIQVAMDSISDMITEVEETFNDSDCDEDDDDEGDPMDLNDHFNDDDEDDEEEFGDD